MFALAAAWANEGFKANWPFYIHCQNTLIQFVMSLEPRPRVDRFTRVVLIGDEHWGPVLLWGRSPTPRDYIAKLISASDRAGAAVIAVDFDLSTKTAGATGKPGQYSEIPIAYAKETKVLMSTIADVASRRPVVLPRVIEGDKDSSRTLLPDIFGPYGICNSVSGKDRWANAGTQALQLGAAAKNDISCGWINLPPLKDRGLIPVRARTSDGQVAPSFALAVAEAWDEEIPNAVSRGMHAASFIRLRTLERRHSIISSEAVIAGDSQAIHELRNKVVLIGGGWHKDGPGRGDPTDAYDTPRGVMPGVLVHENYVEAILDGRAYSVASPRLTLSIEVLLSIVAIFVFAALPTGWSLVAAPVFAAFMLVVSYFAFMNAGAVVDAFAPVVGLWAHTMLHRGFFRE